MFIRGFCEYPEQISLFFLVSNLSISFRLISPQILVPRRQGKNLVRKFSSKTIFFQLPSKENIRSNFLGHKLPLLSPPSLSISLILFLHLSLLFPAVFLCLSLSLSISISLCRSAAAFKYGKKVSILAKFIVVIITASTYQLFKVFFLPLSFSSLSPAHSRAPLFPFSSLFLTKFFSKSIKCQCLQK